MSGYVLSGDNRADAVTGDRIYPHDVVFDTGYSNFAAPHGLNGRNRVVKESTIVWLAEAAGFDVVKRDAGVVADAASVDGSDVGGGGGEASVGASSRGGKSASK